MRENQMTTESKLEQNDKAITLEPSFWLRHTHVKMRENVTGLVAEMQRLDPAQLGNIPAIALDLLSVLDDLTKLTIAGAVTSIPGSPPPPPVAPPGLKDDNDNMDDRIIKLEDFAVDTRDRLARIETKLDTFATKTDVQALGTDLVKWMVGTAVGLGVAGITVMTFVLNNASPKAPPVQATQPIIINVPAAQPAPPAK